MPKSAQNKTLFAISVVAVMNALGYGIIIPLQYAYVARFGINTFLVGILFAAFSLAQFISTPVIGRLSDRFGRKPLLIYSVLGTAVSFFLFAIAHSAVLLFVARILDGISGGNISVAQAVISDATEPKERAKWFGILGAAFGFGFVFGPALGGILSSISLQAPFYFASFISLLCTGIVAFLLKETLKAPNREHKSIGELFHLRGLYDALFEPFVGVVLVESFIAAFAFSVFILGFQAFTNDVLKLTPTMISILFAVFGIIGLLMQGFGVAFMLKRLKEIHVLLIGVILTGFSFFLMGASHVFALFMAASVTLAIGNSLLAPVITALISKHARKEDQGGILGINQSYVSLANIVGPVIGGYLATRSVSFAFFGAGLAVVAMFVMTLIVAREHGKHIVDL